MTYSSENQLAQSLKTYEHIINFFDTSLSNENFNFDIESEIYRTPDKYIFLPITNLKNLQTKKYFHLSQKIIDQKLDIKIVMTIDTSQISHKKYWNLKSVLSELNLLDRVEFISMNTLNFQVLTSRSFLTILDSEILSEVEYHFLKYICIQYNYKFIELNKLDDNNQSFGAFLDKAIITEDLKNHDKISSFNYIDQTTNMFLKIYSQACG